MKKYITFNYLLLFLLGVVGFSMLFGLYLYAFHENPASVINNIPVPTDKDVYHRGEPIYVTIDYCRYTDVPLTRHISFADGIIFALLPVQSIGGPEGCHVIVINIATVPDTLPPGTYHLIGVNEFHVNPLATRYTHWYSQDFEIVK